MNVLGVFAVWPDGLNPGVSLFSAGGTNGVGLMFSLHHPAVRLRLTSFDLLPVAVGVVQLQTELRDIMFVKTNSKKSSFQFQTALSSFLKQGRVEHLSEPYRFARVRHFPHAQIL